ncbi:ABC transporter permease [Streptomyces acidiscabies]|uniref:ABC-2 family transporter protein n=1 Tax=Streptomyces acidiscabies TaxID=42234 RepID=A0A0L0K9M6_9ACTN|nr:ABC transporter permease [Streptomyces acidiscabies]KND34503.1 hypothetical protein IQ63_16160 [Streptomyces acidiscabies]
MSTVQTDPVVGVSVPEVVSPAEALRRACRYEWRHLAGLRSTWVLLGVVGVLSLLTGAGVLVDADRERPLGSAFLVDAVTWSPLATQIPLLAFFLLVLGTGPVSTDLVRGGARTTWLAVGGRATAYAAKSLVGFTVAAGVAAASAVLGSLSTAVVLAAVDAPPADWSGVPVPVLRFMLWAGCWALLCSAAVALLRSRIVPVLVLCLWPLILERLAGGALGFLPGLDGVGGLLPFAAGRAMLTDASAFPADDRSFAQTLIGSDLTTGAATLVFCLYTAVIAGAGCWAYCRRDAKSG